MTVAVPVLVDEPVNEAVCSISPVMVPVLVDAPVAVKVTVVAPAVPVAVEVKFPRVGEPLPVMVTAEVTVPEACEFAPVRFCEPAPAMVSRPVPLPVCESSV